MCGNQERLLDSQLRSGEYVAIGEFKVSTKHVEYALGQILCREEAMLNGSVDGKDWIYKVAHKRSCASKFIAFKDEPNSFYKEALKHYGVILWWPGQPPPFAPGWRTGTDQ